MLGFTRRDEYNELAKEEQRSLESGDAHSLLNIFTERYKNEEDFYFDFELDVDYALVSSVCRDKKNGRRL